MVKVKLNLFESLVGAILVPNIGLIFTTIILIISWVGKQDGGMDKEFIISYIFNVVLMVLSVMICFWASAKSKKEFVLYNEEFEFLNQKYKISQIRYCEYYVCKWYAMPIACVYKQQVGGLFTIKLDTGRKIEFKMLYKDYQRIKRKIPNIVEK